MNKGILIAGIVVVVLLVAFVAIKPSAGTGSIISVDQEQVQKDRYAMFEAEVACKLMASISNVEDPEAFIQGTLQVIDEVNEKYDYTMSEMEANRIKYENDLEFQNLARDYALDICPEVAYGLEMDD